MRKLALVLALGIVLSSVAQADLIGYWPMEEAQVEVSGWWFDITLDASGNGKNLDVTGATLTASGYQGNALVFDGSAYLSAGDPAPWPNIQSAITVSAWVYSTENDGHIVCQGGGWSDPGFSLFWCQDTNPDSIRVELQDSGKTTSDNPAPTEDAWHHVAFTWDQTDGPVRTYIDGTPQGNTPSYAGPIGTPTQTFYVGNNQLHTDRGFDGTIDEVAIWDEALDASSIAFLASGGSPLNALPTELTWDGTVNNWGAAHWTGGPPAFPTVDEKGIINDGHVTVAANRGALALEHNGGDLTVGAGNTLTVATVLASAAGSVLTLEDGSTLAVGSGNIATLQTNGSATLSTAGAVSVSGATFDDQGIPGTFVVEGGGTLTLDNSSGTGVIAGATTFQIDNGGTTLHAIGTDGLGGAAAVTLSGGRLTVEGGPAVVADRLSGSLFRGIARNENALNLDGATYEASGTRVYIGDKAGTILTAADEPGYSILVSGSTQCDDNNDWGPFPTLSSDWEDFVTAYSGRFYPQTTGTYNFHWNNDDAGLMYIDMGDDNVFDSSDRVAPYAWNSNGDVVLTAGQGYNVLYMAQEYGGGRNVHWYLTPPGGSEVHVDPSAQSGMWSTTAPGAVDMTGTPITVTANSEIEAISNPSAALGALTLNDGTTLTTLGDPITFVSTAFGNGSTLAAQATSTGLGPATVNGTGTIDNTGPVTATSLTLDNGDQMNFVGGGSTTIDTLVNAGGTSIINTAGSGPVTILDIQDTAPGMVAKQGAGTLTVQPAGPASAGNTTLRVDAGILHGIGSEPLDGSHEVILNGGHLTVQADTISQNGLFGSLFHPVLPRVTGDQPEDETVTNLEGASYQLGGTRVFTGDKAGTILTMAEVPGYNIIATGSTFCDESNSQDWGPFPSLSYDWDDMVTAFSGTFTPRVSGLHNFHWDNDDRGTMFIDLNDNGTFEAGERVAPWAWNQNGNVNLTAGQAYNAIFMAQEWGGGKDADWRMTEPGGSEAIVDPSDGRGTWKAETITGGIDMATPITVQANATLEAITEGTNKANFAQLNLDNGVTLTTTGSAMNFLDVNIDTVGTISNDNPVTLTDYSDGGGAGRTLVKQGTGLMTLDATAPDAIVAGSTNFRVEQGLLQTIDTKPVGPAGTTITMAGGNVQVVGADVAIPDILIERWFDGDFGDAQLDPIDSGSGFLTMAPDVELALTGPLSYTSDGAMNTRSGGVTGTDTYGALWYGTVAVGASGSGAPIEEGVLSFGTRSDDGSTLWIDIDQSGTFAPGEMVVNNKGLHGADRRIGSLTLLPGTYKVAMGMFEVGGGAFAEARFAQGDLTSTDQGTVNSNYDNLMATIDPSAQAATWSGLTKGAIDLMTTDLVVEASGNLNAVTDVGADFDLLTLHNGTTLSVTGGPVSFSNAIVNGTGTIDHEPDVTLRTYNDSAGAARTLVKQGDGTLFMDNTVPGTVQASSTDLQVDEGTLLAKGLNPLGTVGSHVVLNGGTLAVQGEETVVDGLTGSVFLGTPDNEGPVNLDGANYSGGGTRVFVGDKAGTILTMASSHDAIVTDLINNWDTFPSFDGNADHIVTAFSGQFIPQATGSYNFHWNNDDRGLMYIDMNNDGTFDNGERVASYGWNENGSKTLNTGQAYNVIYMAQEFGGGQGVWWAFTPPGGGEQRVDPGAQAGMWKTTGFGAVDATTTNIDVTANSTLNAITQVQADLGNLTFHNNSTLTTMGGPTSFVSTAIANDSGTFDVQNTVDIGNYIGGSGKTLIKDGPGTMIVDNVAHTINGAGTTFEVRQGLLTADAPDPLGGSTDLTLAGGTASFGDTVAPPAPGPTAGLVSHWTFDETSGTTAADAHGPNPGAISGGVTLGVPGAIGTAFDFDGGSGQVDVGSVGVSGAAPRSIAGWFKSDSADPPSDWRGIFGFYNGSGGGNLFFGVDVINNNDAGVHVYGWERKIADLETTSWHHAAATYDGANISWYYDGILVGSEARAGLNTTDYFTMSWRRDNNNRFDGKIDDVHLYNRALTAAEVEAFYGARTAPDTSSINVLVTANSTLESRSASQLDFNNLTFNNNAEIAITGGPMSFANAIGSGAINSSEVVNLRDVDNTVPGGGGTLIKRGSGPLNLPDGGPTDAYSQTFQVEGGSLNAGGSADPLSGGDLIMAGGTVNLTAPKAPGVIPTGALGAWTFDAGNANDSSGNNYHGTQNGGSYSSDVAEGLGGQSIDLNGNGYINVDDGAGQTVFDLDTLTIAAWVKEWPDGSWEPYVSKRGEGGQGWQIRRHGGSDGLSFTLRGTSGHDDGPVGADRTIDDNPDTWYHIVGTYDGAERKFYVNGILDGSVIPDTGGIANTGSQLVFGARDSSGNAGNPPDIGYHSNTWLDDIYIYNRALTQDEIQGMLPQRGPLVMPDTNVRVAGGGTLNANTDATATFGQLVFDHGTMTMAGAPLGVDFSGGGVDPAATTFGLNNPMDVTVGGPPPFDGGGATATFTKTGAGNFILTQGTTNHGGVAVDVQSGRLISNAAMQAASLNIGGGANVDTGANDATISDGGFLSAGTLRISGSGSTFKVGGDDMAAGPARIGLEGGTVSVRSGGMPGGLVFHLAADAPGTLWQDTAATNPVTGDGQPVARWNDLGPSGINPSEGNTADQPTYSASVASLGGKPALWFEGGSGGDVLRASNSTGVEGNDNRTVITVWSDAVGTGQNYQHTFHMGDTTTNEAYGHSVSRGNNNGQIGNHYWGAGFDATGSGGLGAANIAISTWNGFVGQDTWYVNGGMVGSSARGPLATGTSQLQIGSRLAPITEGFNGHLAEVLVFDQALTAAELNNIGGYLAAKYGIGAAGWAGGIDLMPISLPDTDVHVASNTTLFSDTPTTATYGALSLGGTPGVALSLTGAPGGTYFESIAFDIGGFEPGTEHDQMIFQGPGAHPIATGSELDILTPLIFQQDDVCNWVVLMDIDDPTAYADGIFSHVNPLTGLTEPLPEGTNFLDANGAYFWEISYRYEGNDVAIHLTGIPEPATMALLGLGALALLRRRRRNSQ